jgi:hypothetical protein
LTIDRFCRRENVTVYTFHYWARQLRSASVEAGTSRDQPSSKLKQRSQRANDTASTQAANEARSVVQFAFESGIRVSIPAHCLKAIRCLVESIQKPSLLQDASFREVIVRDLPAEKR